MTVVYGHFNNGIINAFARFAFVGRKLAGWTTLRMIERHGDARNAEAAARSL